MPSILTYSIPYNVHSGKTRRRSAVLGNTNQRHCPVSPLPAELLTGDQASSVGMCVGVGPDRSGFSSASQPFLLPLTFISFPITSRRLTPLARRPHSLEPGNRGGYTSYDVDCIEQTMFWSRFGRAMEFKRQSEIYAQRRCPVVQ